MNTTRCLPAPLAAYVADQAERLAAVTVWDRLLNESAGNLAAVTTSAPTGILAGLVDDGVDVLAGDYADPVVIAA